MKTQATPPIEAATKKNSAIICIGMTASVQSISVAFAYHLGRIQSRGEPLLLAIVAGAIPELRAADAGRAMAADEVALRVLPDDLIEEQILGDDHIAFRCQHLGDVGDAARAV